MEDPVTEIPHVIHLLTQTPPSVQKLAIEKYFTPSAEFIHPFCRTFSFYGSRWAVCKIYQAYKIMSPSIDLEVKSVAFDKENLKLYATISQVFSIFIIPFYKAPVTLTTVLSLEYRDLDEKSVSPTVPLRQHEREAGGETRPLYYIATQEDFYQTSEWIKFIVPFGIGVSVVTVWHAFATLVCILGAILLWPILWLEEKRYLPLWGGASSPLRGL
ncbi:hypothetical protein FQN54_009263 [Arachnomyces sp. PD_36]|nr:hypothetical protein FQN54_009263 [Arachnomyces sp. PD_36]